MKSKDFITESASTIESSNNLHGVISRHLETAQIEDWQDQARAIMQWIRDVGGEPLTAKKPERTAAEMDQDGGYMYRVEFIDTDGATKWLAYIAEFDAYITDKMPDPGSFS